MSKAVLLSIKPEWCELIAKDKTVEIRRNRPKLETPFKCYIYMTKSNLVGDRKAYKDRMAGKVIGEFVCDGIISNCEMANADIAEQQGCISREKLIEYSNGKELFGWHISDLQIYDKPKELSEFNRICPYKKPDGTRMNVPCPCDKYTWAHDEEKGVSYCTRRVTRPPQSWLYVEELR